MAEENNGVEVSLEDGFSVIIINTHKAKRTIKDSDIKWLKSLDSVWGSIRVGSYGMELLVIIESYDKDDVCLCINEIKQYFRT